MKTALLSLSMLGMVSTGFGQLFQQDFSTVLEPTANGAVTDANYVSELLPSIHQFTYLATGTSGNNSIAAPSGALQIATSSTSSNWVAVRSGNFDGNPSTLQVQFTATIDIGSSGSQRKWFFYVGSGFSSSFAAEPDANVHSGFSIRYANGAYYLLKTLANEGPETQADRIPDGTPVKFTFVANNSGASADYTAPDGSTETLADDPWDLWLDNVKRFDDQAATTPGQSLLNFKFGDNTTSSSGRANWTIDDMVINPAVLPLHFSSIAAAANGKQITLNWKMAQQDNIRTYTIEKSTNNVAFVKQINITPHQALTYNWVDENPAKGTNAYRVLAVDKDGKKLYSSVATASFAGTQEQWVFANPVLGRQLLLQGYGLEKSVCNINLLNTAGVIVYTQQTILAEGTNMVVIRLPEALAKGNYFLQITHAGTQVQKKVLIQ